MSPATILQNRQSWSVVRLSSWAQHASMAPTPACKPPATPERPTNVTTVLPTSPAHRPRGCPSTPTPTPPWSSCTTSTTCGWSGSPCCCSATPAGPRRSCRTPSWRSTGAGTGSGDADRPGVPAADGGQPVALGAAPPHGRRQAPAGRAGRTSPAPTTTCSAARAAAPSSTRWRRLPRRQREVLALRYYLDLSEREIAETLRHQPRRGEEPRVARAPTPCADPCPHCWRRPHDHPTDQRLRPAPRCWTTPSPTCTPRAGPSRSAPGPRVPRPPAGCRSPLAAAAATVLVIGGGAWLAQQQPDSDPPAAGPGTPEAPASQAPPSPAAR